MGSAKGITDSAKKGLLYPYNNWANRVAIWQFVRDVPFETNHSTLPVLQNTSKNLENFSATPVIACWGMKDFCFHGQYLQKWENIWPHMQTHRFADSGHYILEDSFEEVRKKSGAIFVRKKLTRLKSLCHPLAKIMEFNHIEVYNVTKDSIKQPF